MNDRRHISMEALQQQIRKAIALQGFAIRHVLSFEGEPEFTYTVGLHLPGSTRPELFISGLPLEDRVNWMLHLGFLIQGPPPLEAKQLIARLQGGPGIYPPGGREFLPGVRYSDLTGNGLPAFFGEVEQRYYEDYFGQALVFHKTLTFRVLQIVWPDPQGRFPFEPGFNPRYDPMQRLLFDPQQYLPLREAQDDEQ